MKIKVCGLRKPDNICEVANLRPDYAGFIFYKPSPRYMGDLPADELSELAQGITKTGVFVNETLENISSVIKDYNLGAVQLHGTESAAFCNLLKSEVTVIKAFAVDREFDFIQLKPYLLSVDYFLFDTKTDKHGGSGQTFDWRILNGYIFDVPFFLSGGLSAENLPGALTLTHPAFYGVDLNSKFETEPGEKDVEKLKYAFKIINK